MLVQDVLRRAHEATKLRVKYKLGAGGMTAGSVSPGSECDCSGFACWALGISRLVIDPFYLRLNGGWANTDGMLADGRAAGGIFDAVPAGHARPGDLIVFGRGPGRRYGHVGVITQTLHGQPTRVVHCSAANTPTAVQETGADVFANHHATVIRHKELVDHEGQELLGNPPPILFRDIYCTEFGGGSESGMPSAYGGKVNPEAHEVSLPARVRNRLRWVIVENEANDRSVRCRVNDVGPWNTHDAYWEHLGGRPRAEDQFHNRKVADNGLVPTNRAGLDATPAVMEALGVPGKLNARAVIVRWWFA